MDIYISTSYDPYYNLAVENWLFHRVLSDTPILYLWQNRPCVIIGRAQNPWRECNIAALNYDNIPIIRRQSGGGTVYHDLGNLNYTIMAQTIDYNKQENLEFIINILKSCKVSAYTSPRNDILVKYRGLDYKISGNAFRETKDKSFHHGTLLINTDTTKLYTYLHHDIDHSLATKGVHSKRSSVINLSEIYKLTIEKILLTFLEKFGKNIKFIPYNIEHSLIISERKKLKTRQWCFEKTMPFSKVFYFNGTHFTMKIVNAHIIDLECEGEKYYSNLIKWIKKHKPCYTKSSFNNENLFFNFTIQEKLLLQYLHKNIWDITKNNVF